MATANPGDILHIPGRLVMDPIDRFLPPTFNGTLLGLVSEVVFKPNLRRREIRGEEYGGEIVDHVTTGQSPLLGCFIRGYDSDMWPLLFDDISPAGQSGKPLMDYPGTTPAGKLASSRSFRLLFAPDDTENVPGIVLYNAYALFEETAQIRYSTKDEFGIAVIFQGVRDSTGRVYQHRLLEDMTLP